MRNPLRKIVLYLLCLAVGGVLIWASVLKMFPGGKVTAILAMIAGITLVAFPSVFLVMALFAAVGEARLRAGRDVIARWHVGAAEWDRFRAMDSARSAQDPQLGNDLWIRRRTPVSGVEVIVGRRQLMVDGSYHVLRRGGLPEMRAVGWFAPPGGPECLEFRLAYPRSRYGGTVFTTLRVPVPPMARGEGLRVYTHFRDLIPPPRPSIAERHPKAVLLGGLGVGALALAVAGVGYVMDKAGSRGELPPILMVTGIASAIGAAIVTIVVALVVQPWRKR